MKKIHKAIEKIVRMYGADVLCDKEVLCAMLDDMIPVQAESCHLVRMIYNDEIGHILREAAQASYSEKDKVYQKLDLYLKEQSGLHEERREEFIRIFRTAFQRKTVEVKSYKEYIPALQILKNAYGGNVSREIIQLFVEENRLFARMSITVDDVIDDLKKV